MAHNNPTRSTRTDLEPRFAPPELTPKQKCEARGGIWNEERQVCILPKKEEAQPLEVPKVTPTTPEVFRDQQGELSGIVKGEQTFLGLSPAEVNQIAQRNLEKTQLPAGTAPVGTAQAAATQQALGQQLAGQVGQIQPSTGITPTGADVGAAFTQGVIGSIPSAIRQAGTFAVGAAVIGGAATAPAGGLGAIPAAAIGAAVGFVSGITQGMISEMRGQRTDNTNAQQRVLDEGKQTLKDWSTLAKADPANREFYLSQFNIQLQQIQDAHVQMLTDTNADVAKFESAIPNLAEFNSFYSIGGERDALVNDMQNSLLTPVSIDYSMIELTNRRFDGKASGS